MGANHRREHHCAIPVNTALCAANAARFERGQYSFRGSENRVPELERLLHEQVCPGRLLALRARGIARPKNSGDQRLSRRHRHRHLEPGRGPMATGPHDEQGFAKQISPPPGGNQPSIESGRTNFRNFSNRINEVLAITSLLTWRRRAKRRGLVSLRDVTPMDPQ